MGSENTGVSWTGEMSVEQKEEFLCNIFHGVMDSILILDSSGKILSYNRKIVELLGMDYTSIKEVRNLNDISSADINMNAAEKYLSDAYKGGDQLFTWRIKRPADGKIIDAEIYLTAITKAGEKVILATIRDITDKKRMEDNLKSSEHRYKQLADNSPDGIVIHRNGTVRYVNPAGALILGGEKAEDILGRHVLEFFTKDKHDRLRERLKMLYEEKVSQPLIEGDMVRIDGSLINVEYAAMPFDMDGKTAVQVVIRDITEKKKQEKYIRFLALHDKLTGLPNRELLADRVAKAEERRKRDDLKDAAFYIDLDGFKPINDTMGHDAGDMALQEIALRLESAIRGSDTAARIGGDEFFILLEGVHSAGEIEMIADRVLTGVNEPLMIREQEFHVGASIGISVFPDDTASHAELMSLADRAMYHVKGTGKNRYEFYSALKMQGGPNG